MFYNSGEKTQDSVVCPIAATRYRGTVAPPPSKQQAARCSAEAVPWRALGVRHVWALSGCFEATSKTSAGKHAFRTSKPTVDSQEHGGRSGFMQMGSDDRDAVRSARGRGALDHDQGSSPGLRSIPPSRLNGQTVAQVRRSVGRIDLSSIQPLGSRIVRDPFSASTPDRAACRLPSRRTAPWNWSLSTRSPSETDRAGCSRRDEQMTTHPSGFLVARAGCPRSQHARSGSPAGMPGNHLLRSATSDAERANWVLLRASTPAPTWTDQGMDDRRDFNDFRTLFSHAGVDTRNAASCHEEVALDVVARTRIRQVLSRRAPDLYFAFRRRR